jgi:hypothetical protein
MELKDYIHYYLGCKIVHPALKNNRTLTAKWMQSLLEKGINFKPILRRLEDITPEETGQMRLIRDSIDYRIKKYAAVTNYLLKQKFDLFGLIEAGLAIDEKKLK